MEKATFFLIVPFTLRLTGIKMLTEMKCKCLRFDL